VRFGFNGWGGKYVLEGDEAVSGRISTLTGLRSFDQRWVLEGGSIEVDGEGTLITTRACLLNANRNPGMTEADIERALGDSLGVDRVLWLGEGLVNDHTDGHIDTLARFVRPGAVVCMEARAADDPNRSALEGAAQALAKLVDARGRRLETVRIPSPGRVVDGAGNVMPASYVNFYVANRAVSCPRTARSGTARRSSGLRRSSPGGGSSASTRGPCLPAAARLTAARNSSRPAILAFIPAGRRASSIICFSPSQTPRHFRQQIRFP